MSCKSIQHDWSYGVLLLTIQIETDLAQIKVLKVEQIQFSITVECSIVHQSNN